MGIAERERDKVSSEPLLQAVSEVQRAEQILANVLRVGYVVFTIPLITSTYDWIQKFGGLSLVIVLAIIIPGLLTFNVQRHKWVLLPVLKQRKIRYIQKPVPMAMFFFYLITFPMYAIAPYLSWVALVISFAVHEWYHRTNQRAYQALKQIAPDK